MSTWSGTRKKLEEDYLCPALRGRVRYFATTYSKCPDHEGRAAILVDGVDKMVDVFPNSILPMPTQNPQKLISGMCSLPDGKTLLILDCGLLLHE